MTRNERESRVAPSTVRPADARPFATASTAGVGADHCRLPWRVGPHYRHDIESPDGRVGEGQPCFSPRAEANAAFICLAVNQHHALVAALTALRNEVVGAIGIGVADAIGHTNARCLGDKCQAAFAVLAQCERRGPP